MGLSCGTIRWFDARRGYGFIIPHGGGPDIFLHRRVLQRAGLRRLAPGTRVRYESERTAAGIKATRLEVPDDSRGKIERDTGRFQQPEEIRMASYLMLSNLTDEGAATIKKNPARIKEVNKEIEAMGVKIVSQYAVIGPFDFATILEAPSTEVVARVSIEMGARGSVRIQTLPLIPIDTFISSVKR